MDAETILYSVIGFNYIALMGVGLVLHFSPVKRKGIEKSVTEDDLGRKVLDGYLKSRENNY